MKANILLVPMDLVYMKIKKKGKKLTGIIDGGCVSSSKDDGPSLVAGDDSDGSDFAAAG